MKLPRENSPPVVPASVFKKSFSISQNWTPIPWQRLKKIDRIGN
jgi:hypothetical protein